MQRNVRISATNLRPENSALPLFWGGGPSGAISQEFCGQFHFVLYADVSEEQDKVKRRVGDIPNLIYVPVGIGETTATLFEDVEPNVKRVIDELPNVRGSSGMAQLGGVGFRAFQKLLESPEHQHLMQFLSSQAIIRTGGRLGHILGLTFISDAGGTGGSAPVLYSRSLIRGLAIHGVEITWQYDVISSVTFTGLGRRIELNAAAAEYRIIRDLTRRKMTDCPQVIESLRLIDLAPHEHNRAARDTDVIIDKQAWLSNQFQFYLTSVRPNTSLNSRFGNMSYWAMDRTRSLCPKKEVIPTVAANHCRLVEAALLASEPVLKIVSAIDELVQEEPVVREETDDLITNMTDVDDTLTAIQCAPANFHVTLVAKLVSGDEFELNRINRDFAADPGFLSEARDDLQVLGSIEAALTKKMKKVEPIIEPIRKEIEQCETELREYLQFIDTGKSSWWLWSMDPAQVREACQALASDLRSASDRGHKQQAILSAIKTDLEAVHREKTYRHRQLKTMADTLDYWRAKGKEREPQPPLVTVRPLDDVFGELLHLGDLPREEQQRCLTTMISGVTLPGLAKMLDTGSSREEAIAQAIAREEFALLGPYPGGRVEFRYGKQIAILPPLEESYQSSLPLRAAQLNGDQQVFVADSCASGAACVRYTVYEADTLRELFPGQLWEYLRLAYEHPNRDLFFPDGVDGLEDDLATGETQKGRRSA
jgi:hypothetical protein